MSDTITKKAIRAYNIHLTSTLPVAQLLQHLNIDAPTFYAAKLIHTVAPSLYTILSKGNKVRLPPHPPTANLRTIRKYILDDNLFSQ